MELLDKFCVLTNIDYEIKQSSMLDSILFSLYINDFCVYNLQTARIYLSRRWIKAN